MKKEGSKKRVIALVITIIAIVLFFFVIIPASFVAGDGSKIGNVAIIPIQGPITTDGGEYFGEATVSSKTIVQFIEEADKNEHVKVIILEINSPGGSAVASDEIGSAIKRTEKPVIAQVREIAASGGYWIASSTDYIIAHKMSITGSIGVISSYLEFSGLLEKYNVSYQRLVAGKYKDMGTPLKPLAKEERKILQDKLDTIHRFFIQEIAVNRGLSEAKVEKLATGEFFLGIEALGLGLVDQLGDRATVEEYIKQTYGLKSVEPVVYEEEVSLLQLLSRIVENFSFQIGKGMASITLRNNYHLQLLS